MSSADLPGEALEVLRDGLGRLYADTEPLPELPQVLEHARRLEGLTVADSAGRHSRDAGWEWTLTFSYRGHRFGIHTSYHAGLSRYSSPDAECPDPLLREVVGYFEGMRLLPPTWVPPPPLTGRRLLLLVLVALAVAAPLTVFLVLSRRQ
jgi:hypothetical protein